MVARRLDSSIAASQRNITVAIIAAHRPRPAAVDAWLKAGGTLIEAHVSQIRKLALDGEPSLARLVLAANLLADLDA